jgi:urea carboxylase
VRAEQELIVLESMKMEIPSLAPHAGVVQQILVAPGDAVGEGQKLAVIAAG